jgi:single-strand DNA-binding protein
MNKFFGIGRLTRDPDMKTTPQQIAVATFTIAIDRKYKDASGNKQADFINIVAWRGTAEFIAKYFRKGSKIVIVGSIQTRTYDDKDGKKVYVTEVVADEIEFAESKQDKAEGQTSDFQTVEDDDCELPFDM